MDTIRSNGENGIDLAQETLNHYVEVGLNSIKNTNPLAAVQNKAFYVMDIFDGLMGSVVDGK